MAVTGARGANQEKLMSADLNNLAHDLEHDFDAEKFFAPHRGFVSETLPDDVRSVIAELCRRARGSSIKMTTIAGSGHPGGSMSSMEFYMLLYSLAKLKPSEPWWEDRDRIIISHGHTSPGVYSALGHNGFFDVKDAEYSFRMAGSPFEGHVERSAPGVDWDTGNLGQGLSVACGKAVAARALGKKIHAYALMGDGEQQKGQISEARRFAVKYSLTNVTAIIDFNQLQISGDIRKVMPQNIADGWRADGWNVVEVDGHDLGQLYTEIRKARQLGEVKTPTVIIAHTVMGKGYPPIENDHNYHGAALNHEQARDAFNTLGFTDDTYNDLDDLSARRADGAPEHVPHPSIITIKVKPGQPRTYEADKKVDNRSAWGNALVDLAGANDVSGPNGLPMIVYDCDLSKSVKTDGFEKKYPERFYQSGISEHSTAACAGSTSAEGVLTFWSDFGVFGISETYNQNRLNDINQANLNVVCTHCGLDVGEDGKTHQCIDYFALSRSVFGWKLLTPADPNQTDRIIRYVAQQYGNFLVVMGRSKMNPLTASDGKVFFGGDYEFRAGRTDLLREGADLTIFCAGNVAPQGMAAWEELHQEGIHVRLISSAHWADFHIDDLKKIAEFGNILTVEDHNVRCGIGASLAAELFGAGLSARLEKLGVTEYGTSGKAIDVYRLMGIDGASVAARVREMLTSGSGVARKAEATSV